MARVFACALLLVAGAAALSVRVPARSDECFLEQLEIGKRLSGVFQVVSGGMLGARPWRGARAHVVHGCSWWMVLVVLVGC